MDNANYSPMQPQPPVWPPVGPQAPFFPTGKREFAFGFVMLILGWLLCNSIFYGGFNLGFAIFACLAVVCTVIYLLRKGCKLSLYSILLLVCALIIAASFARSDDSFVKFILFCFLLFYPLWYVLVASFTDPGIVTSGGDTKFVLKNDLIHQWLIVLPAAFLSAFVLEAPLWVVFLCLKSDQILKCFVAVVKVNRFRWIHKLTRDDAAS